MIDHGASQELDVQVAVRVFGWRREGADAHLSPRHLEGDEGMQRFAESPNRTVIVLDWAARRFIDHDGKGPHDIVVRVDRQGRDQGKRWLCGCRLSEIDVPAYSQDIHWAWQVVRRMSDLGLSLDLRDLRRHGVQEWEASLIGDDIWPWARAEAVEVAICRAALKAMDELERLGRRAEP